MYDCSFCIKGFKHKRSLLRHIRVSHDKTVRYLCGKCLKTFVLKSTLDNHKKDAHKKEKYICRRCEGKYSKKWYGKHLKICRGSNLFYCEKCKYIYMTATDLEYHNEKNHGKNDKNDQNQAKNC